MFLADPHTKGIILIGEIGGEAEESAYAEIVEYVRVGVLLINEEMHPLKAPPRLM